MHLNLMTPIFPQLDVNIPEGWWKQDAQLDLDFANRRAYNKSTQFRGRPDSILTYTSPSPKMVYGDDGVLRYAPHNRFLYSKDLSAASWSKIRGSATADKFSCDSTADASHSFQQNVTTADVAAVLTVELKPAEITTVFIQLGGTIIRAVNLSTGALGSYSLGTSTASLVAADDGYYLLTLFGVPSNTNLTFFAGEGDGSTLDITLAGVRTGEGFYARKLQVSCGTVAFDYIPTTSAAVYALPIEHDPITHAPLGVLIEEQRTNLQVRSQTIGGTGWGLISSCTATLNSAVAPDGTTTMSLLTGSASDSSRAQSQAAITISTATSYTASVYLKAGTSSLSSVAVFNGGATVELGTVTIAWTAGVPSTSTASGASNITYTDVGNGIYRLSFTVESGAETSAVILLYPDRNAVSETVYVWGAQLEAGAFATSYIPTVASQVTRAADRISIAQSGYAFNANAGTFVAEYDLIGYVVNYRVVSGGGSYRYFYGPGSVTTLSSYNGSATVTTTVVSPVGNATKVAMSYDGNGRSITDNGDAISGLMTDANAFLTASTTTAIGTDPDGSSPLNGHIKRLTYFPTRKTNAELQGLSA